MENNVIQTKSYSLALESIAVYKEVTSKRKEYVISKQFLRSATSIGANVEEALGAYSKKEFISKMNIGYKEARETKYWVKLLREGDYLDENVYDNFYTQVDEICKILYSIISTANS